jgi:putative ABC transport system permease protein
MKPENKIRARVMMHTGISMMFHNKLRLLATLAGVLFAVLLSNFALGTFMGLIQKNLFLPNHGGADVWILPKGFRQFAAGSEAVPMAGLHEALSLAEVKSAAPLLYGARSLDTLRGAKEGVQLLGVQDPYTLGGPWNMVAGSRENLKFPDSVILESSQRKLYGNLNRFDVRELGGRRVHVVGFTSGLLPFGPAFAFADYEAAREILSFPRDKASFVLVSLKNSTDDNSVKNILQTRLPEVEVLTKKELASRVLNFLLTATPIGVTFGAISFFGVLVGTVIVSLTMFQSVVDNIKEFGTLKAIGANMKDLTILMTTQAVLIAWIGSLLGVSLVAFLASIMRNPNLALNLPLFLTVGTFLVMTGVCMLAAFLALLRLRKVEPAMVFR